MRAQKDYEKKSLHTQEVQRITNELTIRLTHEIEKRIRNELAPKLL